jgi:hypothetical protein
MSTIRQRLYELDKSKPIYVHCATGQRSYNVVRMLMANGFEAYNIAGSLCFLAPYEAMMRYNDPLRRMIIKHVETESVPTNAASNAQTKMRTVA